MREKPILFSAPMIRAILDGRKSQTRRIIKPQPSKPFGGIFCDGVKWWTGDSLTGEVIETIRVPYAVGDRLWVRETCFAQSSPDGEGVAYPADRSWRIIDHTKEATEKWLDLLYYRRRNDDGFEGSTGKLLPPIHMPRWASRITLEVVAVRVERVQDITRSDIRAEGVTIPAHMSNEESYKAAYHKAWVALWDSINASRGHGWNANPFVWVVEFRRVDR
jgi:hypothetical protein